MDNKVSDLMRKLLLISLIAIAFFAAPAASLAEESGELLGPLRLRDLTPFALQRLDFLPASAAARYPKGWALEANLSYTNTFIMSSNVSEYLEARDERTALDAADFAALGDLAGDAFYFDGSISVLTLSWHYGISESLAAYGVVPVHRYHGGSLDATIESFHNKAGFDDFGRDLVARNQFQGFFKIGGNETLLATAPRSYGFADPVFGIRHRGLRAGDWDVVLELAAKMPWGASDSLFTSGNADVGAQVSLQRQWADHGLYLSASYVAFGGSESFRDHVNRQIPSATVAWETRIGRNTSAIFQATAARSVFRDGTDPELAANQYQMSAGIRHVSGAMHYTFAITENLVNFNNTPDIGFHAGIGIAY